MNSREDDLESGLGAALAGSNAASSAIRILRHCASSAILTRHDARTSATDSAPQAPTVSVGILGHLLRGHNSNPVWAAPHAGSGVCDVRCDDERRQR